VEDARTSMSAPRVPTTATRIRFATTRREATFARDANPDSTALVPRLVLISMSVRNLPAFVTASQGA